MDKYPGVYNIEVELDPKALPDYAKGRPNELDNQWTIGPSEKPNQYTLRNRRKSLGLLTYTTEKLPSGVHAAILDSADDRSKMSPGGPWRNGALWMFRSDRNDNKYYKIENVGKKGHTLTWTYEKYNQYNHFIQLVSYNTKEDGKFLFTPSSIKLSGRIYDFKFKDDPETILRDKKNQQRSLVSKHRYPNNSPATITQTLEETVEMKETITISFKESFSMMLKTSVEINYLIFKGAGEWSFKGGFSATQTKMKENTRRTTLKTEIKVPPYTDVEASIYNVWADNVVLPFEAKMLVTGVAERILVDQPSRTVDGKVPGSVIEAYIKATGGKNMKIIKRTGDNILVALSGQVSGNIGIESTVSTTEIKRPKSKSG